MAVAAGLFPATIMMKNVILGLKLCQVDGIPAKRCAPTMVCISIVCPHVVARVPQFMQSTLIVSWPA